ncbi:MAG: hypothetical protein JWN64_836 [Parcubacteria group bacterium]|nr:hypothetical protein [Parcubacteria group bacterium]
MTYRSSIAFFVLVFVFGAFVALPVSASAAVTLKFSAPECKVKVTNSRIHSGGTTTIKWTSKNATSMTAVSKKDLSPNSGKTKIGFAVPGNFEIPLVFKGPGGEATCTAVVHVKAKTLKK